MHLRVSCRALFPSPMRMIFTYMPLPTWRHAHLVTDDRKLLDYASTEEAQNIQNYETLSADDFLMQLTEYAHPLLICGGLSFQESLRSL